MWQLFLQSARLHIVWWFRSWWPGSHPAAPLSLRRVLFLLFVFPAFAGLQLCHWIALGLDTLLFPEFRKTPIHDPVFIIGIPRSGTTFIHRTLALDRDQFSSVPTWEALFAPAILEKRVLLTLARLDQRIGHPFRRLLDRLSAGSRRSMDSIHPTGLDEPEEDYLWLLPAGGALIGLLAFPFSRHLRELASFDRLPPRSRNRWIEFHRDCIRRHLFVRGAEKRFLSKNAAFPSWISPLAQAYPDAAFVLTVRQPASAIRSQLRSLEPARRLFATDPDGTWTERTFSEVLKEGYDSIARPLPSLETSEPFRTAVVTQEDLATDSGTLLPAVLQRIDARQSTVFEQEFASRQPHRTHPESTPTPHAVPSPSITNARTAYEKILATASRIRPNQDPS